MSTEPSGARADGTADTRAGGRAGARAGGRKPPPRRRRKARMVHRVVRHVEVWSVAKVAAAFAVCGYVVGMISGYLLWRAADRVGTIDGIEGFMEDSGGYDTFEIVGSVVFQSALAGFAVLSVLFVALAVLGALLFNLISDLTGGIRMTAIDEDLIVTPARRPGPGAPRGPDPRTASPPETAPERAPEKELESRATPETAPAERTAPAADPWKTPAPNETWSPPAPSPSTPTNGHSVVERDVEPDVEPDDEPDDEPAAETRSEARSEPSTTGLAGPR